MHFLHDKFPVELTNHIVALAGPKAALNVRRVNREGRSRMDAFIPSAQSGLALVIRRADPPTPEGWPPAVRARIVVDNMGEAELERLFRNLPPTIRFLAVQGRGHSHLPNIPDTPVWRQLRSLSLDVLGVLALPGLHHLSALEELSVNGLEGEFPSEVLSLGNLRVLSLKETSIEALPHGLYRSLPKLEEFRIEGAVTEYPDDLWMLPKLKSLALELIEAGAWRLPASLGRMQTLEALHLQWGELDIPAGALPASLRTLDIACEIDDLPADFANLPHLHTLYLMGTDISSLEGVLHLPALQRLAVFPPTIQKCWRAWKRNPTYPFAKALARLQPLWAAHCIAQAARHTETEEFMEFCELLAPKASYKQVMALMDSYVPLGAKEKVMELYRRMGDPGLPPAVSPAVSPGAVFPGAVSPGAVSPE